jgi:large subunit ribosomal protein L35
MPPPCGPLVFPYTCIRCSIPETRVRSGSLLRSFSTQLPCRQDVQTTTTSQAGAAPPPPTATPTPLNGEHAWKRTAERKVLKDGGKLVGDRRRRAVLATGSSIPFEQLPYQCFQEARKVLQEDRDHKVKLIDAEREKIARLVATEPYHGTPKEKELRLYSMRRYLEDLKIKADINDPLVKKKFEDGMGQSESSIKTMAFLLTKRFR